MWSLLGVSYMESTACINMKFLYKIDFSSPLLIATSILQHNVMTMCV